jgi:hypothetical protein
MGLPMAWPCVDPACGNNLGNIASGELVVVKENVAAINTDKTNMVLTCVKCGKPKTWFAKPSAIVVAFVDDLAKKIAKELGSR